MTKSPTFQFYFKERNIMDIVTTKQAAEILGVKPQTIDNYVKKGQLIPKIKGIRGHIFDKKDVESFQKRPAGRPKENKNG